MLLLTTYCYIWIVKCVVFFANGYMIIFMMNRYVLCCYILFYFLRYCVNVASHMYECVTRGVGGGVCYHCLLMRKTPQKNIEPFRYIGLYNTVKQCCYRFDLECAYCALKVI